MSETSGSPSGKVGRLATTAFDHEEDEDESKIPLRTKIWNYLEEAMEESAPAGIDGQDMKTHGILIPITVIYIMVFFAALFYFAVQGAIQIEGQRFLSAEKQDGSICDTVATYITATYEADLNGAWSTFSGTFKVNSSYYSLKFTGGPVDQSSYRSNMLGFQTKLNALGAKAANRDVTYTLLAMSALELTATDVTGLAFSSNVVSDVTFGALTPYSWAIVNYQGRCYGEKNSTYVTATYDKAEKSIVIGMLSGVLCVLCVLCVVCAVCCVLTPLPPSQHITSSLPSNRRNKGPQERIVGLHRALPFPSPKPLPFVWLQVRQVRGQFQG